MEARGLLKSLPLHALSLLLELQHREQDLQVGSGQEKSAGRSLGAPGTTSAYTGMPGLQQRLHGQGGGLRELERLQHPQTLKKIAEEFLRDGQYRRAHDLFLRVGPLHSLLTAASSLREELPNPFRLIHDWRPVVEPTVSGSLRGSRSFITLPCFSLARLGVILSPGLNLPIGPGSRRPHLALRESEEGSSC